MTNDISQLLTERQALRGLADMALRFRGELNGSTSETADYIQRVIDETVDRWAVSDRQAREALRSNEHVARHLQRMLNGCEIAPEIQALGCVLELIVAERQSLSR